MPSAPRAPVPPLFGRYYFNDPNVKCVGTCDNDKGKHYPHGDTDCTDLPHNDACWNPVCHTDCYATESRANNFIALRRLPSSSSSSSSTASSSNTLYVEFMTGNQSNIDMNFSAPDFIEYYDVAADTWHMHNLASSAPSADLTSNHDELHRWYACAGDACP